MMSETAFIDIQFKGKLLAPKLLAEKINLPIEALVSSGELGKVGRYKGKPMPYGIGLLKINPTVETINEYSDILLKNKSKLKKYNVDEIIFDVDASSEELEKISISSGLLKKLSALNAKIQFYNNETANDDFSVLLEKIITKVSTLAHPNKQKIKDFFHLTASSIDVTHLKSEYVYAIIISFLENSESTKKVSKQSLKKAAQEFEKI
ncbi:MAG TPA: hypothetical protein PKC39_07470 [Ferruginibacter sp.]|nr:hypothetical protein [Ferruginibacter sp.]HMP20782.1 hypothetical protein [Ferruginibacter sp.]